MQRNAVICKGEKRGAWRKTEMTDHHTPESHKQHRSGTIWRTLHSSSSVSHYAWLPPTPTPGESSLPPFFELNRISFSSLNVLIFLQDVTCPLSPFGWGPIIRPPPPSADIPQPKTIHSSLHSPRSRHSHPIQVSEPALHLGSLEQWHDLFYYFFC